MKHRPLTIPGFQFAGIHCGIKDTARKKDLSLIYSEEPHTLVEGVFTTNRVQAPSVDLCRKIVKRGRARLVVINSGIANACTGLRGMKDAQSTQKMAAKLFGLKAEEVLVSSTGKIGEYLPMKNMIQGLKKAHDSLDRHHFFETLQGMMTTDQYPKYAVTKGWIGNKRYTMAVLAKGAGMLRPDMATLLAYIVTDLKFSRPALKSIFRKGVDETLNRVTVDGDTSTNDTVLILANGRAGNPSFSAGSPAGKKVTRELTSLLQKMARKITLDGEGATKCCEVYVTGARSEEDARKIAYAIGNSPLVKTALFGCDPNWGRMMAAVGYSGAQIREENISIKMGPHLLVRRGVGLKFNIGKVSQYMKRKEINILVNCGLGPGKFHIYMSDLTYDYIHLNAEYHT